MNKIKTFIVVIFQCLIYEFVLSVSYEAIIAKFTDKDKMYNLSAAISAAIVLIILIFFRRQANKKQTDKDMTKKGGQICLLFFETILLLLLLSNILNISPIINRSDTFNEYLNVLKSSPVIFLLLNTVVMSPLIEEIMFRGIALEQLKGEFKDVTAVIISALLFGIVHQNIVQFIYAFVGGVLFGVIYLLSNSLLCTYILHALVNLITVVRTYNNIIYTWESNKNNFYIETIVIAIISIVLATIALRRVITNKEIR